MDYSRVDVHSFYAFVLILARVGGVLAAAPVLGGRTLPRQIVAGFSLLLSLALTPLMAPRVGMVPEHLLLLAGAVCKEALLGLALGNMARLLFGAIEMAGFLEDAASGFGFVSLMNPASEHQSSVLTVFQYQLGLAVYLLANGHLMLLSTLAESFTAFAPGDVPLNGKMGLTIVPMVTELFALGFRLALPAVGVLFVIDVAFGLVARMAPQINVMLIGLPAKILLGLFLISLLLPVLAAGVGQIALGAEAGLRALTAARAQSSSSP